MKTKLSKTDLKHDIFVNEYLIDFNATRAYIAAGYSPKDANTNASKLLQITTIKTRIEEAQKKVIEKSGLTKQSLVDDLIQIKELARFDEKNLNNAIKAIEVLNKMHGYNEPEKIDHKHENTTINYIKPNDGNI